MPPGAPLPNNLSLSVLCIIAEANSLTGICAVSAASANCLNPPVPIKFILYNCLLSPMNPSIIPTAAVANPNAAVAAAPANSSRPSPSIGTNPPIPRAVSSIIGAMVSITSVMLPPLSLNFIIVSVPPWTLAANPVTRSVSFF